MFTPPMSPTQALPTGAVTGVSDGPNAVVINLPPASLITVEAFKARNLAKSALNELQVTCMYERVAVPNYAKDSFGGARVATGVYTLP